MTNLTATLTQEPTAEVEAKNGPPPTSLPPPPVRVASSRRLTMRRLHKWTGIIAAIWLTVLGVTGFFLDHRDWRWIWQTSVTDSLFPEKILEKRKGREFLSYRINPDDTSRRITAGKRGLWWSEDAGESWRPARFAGLNGVNPQVFSIVDDLQEGWKMLLAATDDGVWRSVDSGETFTYFALRGEYVNSLTQGAKQNELIGAVSRSLVFTLNSDNRNVRWLDLKGVDERELPEKIGFSRFIRDLHYGRGLVNGVTSVLINDAGGIAMVILPVTGILFWLYPLRWKRKKVKGSSEHIRQRKTMRWLHRWHGVYAGLFTAIIISYLAITGIFIDHSADLRDWMKTIKLDRSWLPPVYELHSWDGEIYSLAGYPGVPGKVSIGARSGLYTSSDNGETWLREKLPYAGSCFVWSLKRVGDNIFIGGMGCTNYMKKDNGPWQVVKGMGHMPTDVIRLSDGKIAWKSHKGLMTDKKRKVDAKEPHVKGTPLFYLIDGLHSGMLFHPQWKWVNDLFSVMALALCGSGLYRLWRQRRLVYRHFGVSDKGVR